MSKLGDVIALEIATVMETNLDWLDTAFGKAEKRDSGFGTNKYIERTKRQLYPAIHDGKGNLLDLFPTMDYGNFMYQDFSDPQLLDNISARDIRPIYTIGLVFYFDLREIYDDHLEKSVEDVKHEVLQVIRTNTWISGKVSPIGFDDKVENIYKGYLYEEAQDQPHMRPFGGFRLNVSVRMNFNC